MGIREAKEERYRIEASDIKAYLRPCGLRRVIRALERGTMKIVRLNRTLPINNNRSLIQSLPTKYLASTFFDICAAKELAPLAGDQERFDQERVPRRHV